MSLGLGIRGGRERAEVGEYLNSEVRLVDEVCRRCEECVSHLGQTVSREMSCLKVSALKGSLQVNTCLMEFPGASPRSSQPNPSLGSQPDRDPSAPRKSTISFTTLWRLFLPWYHNIIGGGGRVSEVFVQVMQRGWLLERSWETMTRIIGDGGAGKGPCLVQGGESGPMAVQP